MTSLDLGIIGNCSFSALVDEHARIVWSCMPRFDGDPVFCELLSPDQDEAGIWEIALDGLAHSQQRYVGNTAVLETILRDANGSALEIVDFVPRFKQYGRTYRPNMIVRKLRPLSGAPRITIRLRPRYDYGARQPETTRGSNHVRYTIPGNTLRLTTDVPVTYIEQEVAFFLDQPRVLVLGPDESFASNIVTEAEIFREETIDYWLEWCRYLSLPFEWQDAVIRAAITLKLCSFEETGAVIAAPTTSIPEAPESGRNWDYRYCWLRDAYFTVHALNRLGVTRTMEGYLSYISNIVAGAPQGFLQPVFGIGLETDLREQEATALRGYRGMGPVRIGNGAHAQVQNDGYGSVVLASAQSFFDSRLTRPGDETLFRRLELMGEQAVQRWDQPDAGLWELRTREHVHTYSSVMCWAACHRLGRIADRLGLPERGEYWREHASTIRAGILEAGWNAKLGSFVSSFGGEDIDASLLLLPELGFVTDDDPRMQGTLELVEQRLRKGPYVFRYHAADDFGEPRTAFNVCTFWYINRLASIGRGDEARDLFENLLAARNHLGLMSEDIALEDGEMWGNFPQTYSMVGLIQSAMKLSRSWEDAF